MLLAEDKGGGGQGAEQYSRGGEIKLAKHIPVHVTYLTARVDENGKLQTTATSTGSTAARPRR